MRRQSLFIVWVAVGVPLLAACAAPGAGAGRAPGEPAGRRGRAGGGAAVPVLTARVAQKAVPVTVPAVGTVEAMSSVQIRAQVTGQLSAIHFEEGQEVVQGQPLFSLDSGPLAAARAQAEAVLARDTATLQNAQAQQARSDNLFQRGLVPRDLYEGQRASVAALAATVAADKAAVETARLNLEHAEIVAPINGRTGTLGIHVGDLARANDTIPMVVINQLSPVYVTFSVPERFLPDIRRFQARRPLAVLAAAVSDPVPARPAAPASGESAAGVARGTDTGGRPEAASPPVRGTLSFIDNAVDRSTGTIRLKGTFPNADHQLWPGAFVRVTLDLTTDPKAVVVPATAIQTSQDGQYVFVVKADRTVEMRPVRIERQQGDEMVVAQGVSAGEVVVTDGQLRLTPGARVSERGPAAERAAGAGPDGRTAAGDGAPRSGR